MSFRKPVLTTTTLILLLSSIIQSAHVRESDDFNGSQYLAFNGTITTTVTYPSDVSDRCKDITFGPYIQSYLYVGLNPPWDPNPFFFELYHRTSEWDAPMFGFTNDSVYNLDFASSAYACWTGGSPCPLTTFTYHFVPEILLDLTKVGARRVKVGGEDGYEIEGDEKTFVKNGTERATVNGVDVADGCYVNGVDWDGFTWNETTSWTYKISFSNSTGAATIRTDIGRSTMEITFSGERITNTTYPNVELVTADDSKPQFRFSNDTEIHFRNASGVWQAAPTEFVESSSIRSTATIPSTLPTGSSLATGTAASRPSSTGAADALHTPKAALAGLVAVGGLLVL